MSRWVKVPKLPATGKAHKWGPVRVPQREPRAGDVFLWPPYQLAVMYLGPGHDEVEHDVWAGVYLNDGTGHDREVGAVDETFGSLTETEGGDYRWQFLGNPFEEVGA